jgi:hypothetical protein
LIADEGVGLSDHVNIINAVIGKFACHYAKCMPPATA